jgi:hypothetical protein
MRSRIVSLALLVSALVAVLSGPANAATSPLKWSHPTKLANQPLTALTCPDTSFCAAGAGRAVYTSSDPMRSSGRWLQHAIERPAVHGIDAEMTSLSCPSDNFCAGTVVNGPAEVVASNDPSEPGSRAWRSIGYGEIGSDSVLDIACPLSSLCLGGDQQGNVEHSRTPAVTDVSWTSTPVDSDSAACQTGSQSQTNVCPGDLSTLTCPARNFCVGVDSLGYVYSSEDPTGGANQWQTVRLAQWDQFPNFNQVYAQISCPTRTFCAFVFDPTGQIFTSTDPHGGDGAWHLAPIRDRFVQAISCASEKLCVAVDSKGYALTSADPAARAPSWVRSQIDRARSSTRAWYAPVQLGLTGVACPSTKACVAVDGFGNELVGDAS